MTSAAPPLPFVMVIDQDGKRHAVRRQAVIALVEDPPGCTTMLLSGARLIILDEDLATALANLA